MYIYFYSLELSKYINVNCIYILFSLIIHNDSEPNLLVRACNQLGQFLSHRYQIQAFSHVNISEIKSRHSVMSTFQKSNLSWIHPFLLNSSFYSWIHFITLEFILLLLNSFYYSWIHPNTLEFILLLLNSSYYSWIHTFTLKFILLLLNLSYYSKIHPSTVEFILLLLNLSYCS